MISKRVAVAGCISDFPQLYYAKDNKPCITFQLSINGTHEGSFVQVIIHDNIVKFFTKNFCKGSLILIEGYLKSKVLTVDNKKRTAVQMIADDMQDVNKTRSLVLL